MKFVKAFTRETVYIILDIIYRLASCFVEWYYEWIDKK